MAYKRCHFTGEATSSEIAERLQLVIQEVGDEETIGRQVDQAGFSSER